MILEDEVRRAMAKGVWGQMNNLLNWRTQIKKENKPLLRTYHRFVRNTRLRKKFDLLYDQMLTTVVYNNSRLLSQESYDGVMSQWDSILTVLFPK